jgi:hypothetical protein
LNTEDEPVDLEKARAADAAAADKWLRGVEQVIAEVARDVAAEGGSGKHLITVDELRAAGAFDVPEAWRKSLGGGERDLFSDLDEDDGNPENQDPAEVEPED